MNLIERADAAGPQEEPDGFEDLREYLRGLRRRWRLVLLSVLLALAAGVLHFLVTPPVYQAKTMLQIERRNPASLISTQAPWLENLWNMEYYPTQYKLLESRGMAERVVEDLRLDEDPRFNPAAGSTGGGSATSAGDRAVLAQIAQRLRGGLSVEPIRGTQLVELKYRSAHPELAARIANGFAQTFIEWGIETQSVKVDRAWSFLGEQIEALKQEVAERERQLQALSRNQEVLDFTPDTDVTARRLEALNQQYMEAKRQRIEKEARFQELVASPDLTVAGAEPGGVTGNLLREQLRLEREYETRLQTYKPDWPDMVELKAEIDQGRRHLDSQVAGEAQRVRQSAQAEYQTARRQEQALEGEIEELKRQMFDNSTVAVQYSNLQVEISTRRDLLDELLRRQSETEVAVRIQSNRESNVRVVDEALVPGAPFQPSLRRSLSMSLIAGLLVGVAGALLLEYLDRSIKSPEEIERLLALPALAVIPDLSQGERRGYGYGYGRQRTAKARLAGREPPGTPVARPGTIELAPHHQPRLAVSEAYRSLRTALLLSSAQSLRVVAVTSANAGEGKTVTAVNLAVVMAQLGRRVLLIDGDLRKPRLHSVFRLPNRDGVVHHLTAGVESEEVTLGTEIPNLWVMPSGPIPPNPSELLASSRMADLIQAERTRFDFVLIDTPPALAVTDATLVGALADGVVLCLRAGEVLREDARSCRDRLERADVKILGAVLNALRGGQGRYGKGHRHYEEYAATLGEPEAGSAA